MTAGRGAALAVLAAWVTALVIYGREPDLAQDDLCYLSSLHDFLLGYEARKDYSHLAWGLLHAIGHLDLLPGAWRAGRVGASLALFGTSIVPFCAWVTYRLTGAVVQDRRAALIAAALAAWSPAVLQGAGTLGFWSRAGAVGLGLLGIAKLLDALRSGRSRDAAAAVLLQGAGLAVHPWALTAPAIALPLVGWVLWARRGAGWRTAAAVGTLDGVLLVGLLVLSAQGHRVEAGTSHLWGALGFMPLVAASHGAWQLPAVGLLVPRLPGTAVALVTLAGMAALIARPTTRSIGLLVLGGLVAALPEAAAPIPPRGWDAAWTGNFIKACVGMELVAVVAMAALFARVRAPSRGLLVAVALVAGATVGRGVVGMQARASLSAQDSAAARTLGKALAGAATLDERLGVVGSLAPLGRASFASKFDPEASAGAHGRHAAEKAGGGPYAGVDLALWRVSTMRCELRMGMGAPAIVPPDRDARHRSPCQAVPEVLTPAQAGGRRCTLSFEGERVRFACPVGPPHAGPADSRDPAALPLALAALMMLGGALGVSGPLRSEA